MTMTPLNKSEDVFVLIFLDITRAHPHATMNRDLWVALPEEDPRFGEIDLCALLLCNVCGTRDAGQNFTLFTFEVMDTLGFVAGVWSPCIFQNEEENIQAYVYGDNFVLRGDWAKLHIFFGKLNVRMWAKLEGVLEPSKAAGDVQEIVCLNRFFRWCTSPTAIEIEGDPRHAEILVSQANLEAKSSGVVTPGVKPTSTDLGGCFQFY